GPASYQLFAAPPRLNPSDTMGHLLRDEQYACRVLVRAPMFSLVALACIALGIGANTAIFTLLDEVLLRTLPLRHHQPHALISGARTQPGSHSGGNMLRSQMYEDFRDNFDDRLNAPALPRVSAPVENPAPHPAIFTGMFARRTTAMIVGVDGQAERVPGEL